MNDADSRLRIMQVSTADALGGAESVARNLFCSYRSNGLESWLVVGRKRSGEPDVLPISGRGGGDLRTKARQATNRWLQPVARRVGGAAVAKGVLRGIADPPRAWERLQGHEDFDYPATYGLLDLTVERPTILHCHNLHGGFFDLRALPWLSSQVATILTLHDAWLLSGHCAHSLACERWQTGCGECPDLGLYPAVRRDATAFNWQRKRDIYARSRLYVATPCEWLMAKVRRSILAPAIVESRIINNGVDLSVFRPGDRQSARVALGIPQDARMLLFSGYGMRKGGWKDHRTILSAVTRIAGLPEGKRVLCVALGEESPVKHIGQVELRFVPYQKDPDVVARYCQAADIYLSAARAETMSLAISEALACGIPVVASAVGGTPEQIKDAYNGVLVQPGDAGAMADAIVRLLSDEALRTSMGRNAAEDARLRFDLRRQVDAYTAWYREISSSRHYPPPSRGTRAARS